MELSSPSLPLDKSNVKALVDELTGVLKDNPAAILSAVIGNDKKAQIIYNMAQKMFNINEIVGREIDKLTSRNDTEWLEIEDLILGVIEGDEDCINRVKQYFLGVVKM